VGGACSEHGDIRNAYRILVGKPEGMGLHGRPSRRWKELDLRVTGFGGVDWIHLAQHRDRCPVVLHMVTNRP
jgi:hypothetical protein